MHLKPNLSWVQRCWAWGDAVAMPAGCTGGLLWGSARVKVGRQPFPWWCSHAPSIQCPFGSLWSGMHQCWYPCSCTSCSSPCERTGQEHQYSLGRRTQVNSPASMRTGSTPRTRENSSRDFGVMEKTFSTMKWTFLPNRCWQSWKILGISKNSLDRAPWSPCLPANSTVKSCQGLPADIKRQSMSKPSALNRASMTLASMISTLPSSITPGHRFLTTHLQEASTSLAGNPTTWHSKRHKEHMIAATPSKRDSTKIFGPFGSLRGIAPAAWKGEQRVAWNPGLWSLCKVLSPSSVNCSEAHSPPPFSEASLAVTSPLTSLLKFEEAIGNIMHALNLFSCNLVVSTNLFFFCLWWKSILRLAGNMRGTFFAFCKKRFGACL